MRLTASQTNEPEQSSSCAIDNALEVVEIPEIPRHLAETMERDVRLPEGGINAYLFALLTVAASTAAGFCISPYLHEQGVIMVYLLAVVLVSSRYGLAPAMVTCAVSMITFDFFLVRPRLSFEPADPQAMFSFVVMLIVAIFMGQLTARIRRLVLNLELRVQRRTLELRKTNLSLRREIAKRAEAEARLMRTVEALAESNESLQQFARVASHDLQEPLRSLRGYAELLVRRYSQLIDDKGRTYLDQLQEDAGRMERLIDAILAHARVRERSKGIVREPVNLSEVVGEALANLRVAVRESSTIVDCRRLPEVMGERWQLVQLFQNLISNAIRYSGERRPMIKISAERFHGFWKVSIEDNGVGVEERDREEIFKMFRRIRRSSRAGDCGSGTGIGLAICKSVVKNHGGALWVESEPGEGSSFQFTLPVIELENGAEEKTAAVRDSAAHSMGEVKGNDNRDTAGRGQPR